MEADADLGFAIQRRRIHSTAVRESKIKNVRNTGLKSVWNRWCDELTCRTCTGCPPACWRGGWGTPGHPGTQPSPPHCHYLGKQIPCNPAHRQLHSCRLPSRRPQLRCEKLCSWKSCWQVYDWLYGIYAHVNKKCIYSINKWLKTKKIPSRNKGRTYLPKFFGKTKYGLHFTQHLTVKSRIRCFH